MLRGNSEQRARAKEILTDTIADTDGTPVAQDARRLLELAEAERPVERDPEMVKFTGRWDGLQGVTDPNLVRWLRDLHGQPGLIARLRPMVVKGLRKWIEQTTPLVAEEGLSPKELETVKTFVKEVCEIDAYSVDELKPLRKVLFQLHYHETKGRIETALKQWAVEDAWGSYGELIPTPEDFSAEVQQIQVRIYEVEQLRQSVQELLSHPPEEELGSWVALRLLVTSLQRCAGYLDQDRLPDDWRGRIEEVVKNGLHTGAEFLRKQAMASVVIKDIRDFWAEYSGLELTGFDDRLALKEDWFRSGLTLISKAAHREITGAASPDQLNEIGWRLTERPESLPPAVAERLKELANEIAEVTAYWQAMLSGDEFEPVAADQTRLTVPTAFKKAAPAFRKDLEQVAAALARIRSGEELSEQVYHQSAKLADAILARVPGHAQAGKLKKEAERGILCWRLDESLRRWDISEFLRLCLAEQAEGIYSDLARREKELNDLGRLAGQPEFSNWSAAAEWWNDWRIAKGELPQPESDWPNSLRRTSRQQEATRRDEWYKVLDALTGDELTPEEAQAAADSLKPELRTLNLQGYQRALARQAAVGRADRHIDSEEFDMAGAEIAKLDEDHEDALRLRTRLSIEQAKLRGVNDLADVLFREWHTVVRYLNDGAHTILQEVVQQAWEQEKTEAVDKLRGVISRVLGAGNEETAELKQLRNWADWLSVEQAVRAETSLLTVRKVADYLRRAEPGRVLRERLERLAGHWEAQQNTVMLAWAYQAFNRIDPLAMPRPVDPVEALNAKGRQLAEAALERLRKKSDLRMADLREMQAGIEGHESKLKELDYYLELLNFPEEKNAPAPEFSKAKRLLEILIHIFDTFDDLRGADWREDKTIARFNAARVTIRRDLVEVAAQQKLLDDLEKWDDLVRLKVLEDHLREAAEKCGSDDIYEDGHFADLKKQIEEMIKVLVQTGAESWPIWPTISVESCDLVYKKAGILKPKIQPPDLRALADLVARLMKEEQEFKQALDDLARHMPPVAPQSYFDPELHAKYLKRFPDEAPGSRKVYLRFDRFATSEPMWTILKQSRSFLPDWVRKYLQDKESPDV